MVWSTETFSIMFYIWRGTTIRQLIKLWHFHLHISCGWNRHEINDFIAMSSNRWKCNLINKTRRDNKNNFLWIIINSCCVLKTKKTIDLVPMKFSSCARSSTIWVLNSDFIVLMNCVRFIVILAVQFQLLLWI